MDEKKYTLPGMTDWTFNAPTLQHKGGAGIRINANTSPQEIAAKVKEILRGTTYTPDEAAFEVIAQASQNIDWQTMLGPYPVLSAPLLNAAPVLNDAIAGQKVITVGQIEEICENLKSVYYGLKGL